jgi:signal transduction histidine kinase
MSFRAKLTVWYSLRLGILFAVFGYSAHLAMLRSSSNTVDHGLRSRLRDAREFLRREAPRGETSLVHELQEQASLALGGDPLEFWDQDGKLLYRSARAEPGDLGPDVTSLKGMTRLGPTDIAGRRGTTRMAAAIDSVGARSFAIRVGQSMEEFEEAQENFDRLLFYLAPLLLAISVAAGLVFSKRALSPVQKMGRDAHKITVGNLSQRLAVPAGKDELHELAVTLNEMLGRIDGEVQRMIQFTEDASHELRAPLTLIHSAAEFSLRGKRTEQELLDALGKVLRESARTTRLIGGLLTLARTGEMRLETVDLTALIQSTAGRLADSAQARSIDVTFDLSREDVYVTADESSLGRLFLILLDNALKYTEAGGHVSIVLKRQSESACVIIADTGIGIAAMDLPKIWDRFWRADKVRSRNAGGTGLGLAIARAIANQHGAELSVESTPGHGSRFQLRLHAVPAPSTEQENGRTELSANPNCPPIGSNRQV